MESSEISEEITDWQEIQFPSNSHTSSSSPPAEHLNRSTGIKEQEDLPFHPEEGSEPVEKVDSSPSPLSSQGSETDLPHHLQMKSDSKLLVFLGEVKTIICASWKRMTTALRSSFQCPTFVPAAALAVVILACVKIVQGRNRLFFLIREKDRRISQLLHQIAHMNDILSARRRVPVLRIN
ncbi:hypothetical protein Cgig2_023200 [Carnegiea gigantea]|uniref:Uncharacterized protein n=1 Tax=Carnegiea gigantea TaxID=171969 RepID=A0A9Q1JYM0_9CARY|nr:hypothetical protein Cgig2_023200 [Carnegiea gigantea]